MWLARPTNQNLKFLELWYLSRYGFENRWEPGVLDPVLYTWMPYDMVLKSDENLELWIQCYIHKCHTSLFGTWGFKSNQNLKFSGFNIWTCSSWSNRKFKKSIWFMILFYEVIYFHIYMFILLITLSNMHFIFHCE